MPKILVADDEANIVMLVKVMFQDLDYTVITASDGHEALIKAEKEKPDMIITDIVMPKKDGFEVCREIRKNPVLAQTPIIILSAMGDEYNKINGFEEGADDYVTKPFNIEELKLRVKALLMRSSKAPKISQTKNTKSNKKENQLLDYVSTGVKELDSKLTAGGLPNGSNILVIGAFGLGKSWLGRKFMLTGLQNKERNLFVALDDDPQQIKKQLSMELGSEITEFENKNMLKFVDAYSWSSLTQTTETPYTVTGTLDLNQLSGVIADASTDLGQTVQAKMGGRRVIDSISSLFINFDLAQVQRFITQISRTAVAFGGVTTLFLLEENTIDPLILNNIKYLMDGIIEFKEIKGKPAVRIASMKWADYSNEPCFLTKERIH